MQSMILLISLVGMAAMIAIFLRAVSKRATVSGSESAGENTERSRKSLIWGLLVFGVIVTAGSLWHWPHDASASSNSVSVNVTGGQWYWEIDRETMPTGTPIIFNVRAKDVNHGMAVYSADGTLLFQAQGMPGYVNKVRYVFKEPGTYKIFCLEFCGLSHHDMTAEFKVVASGAGSK